MTKCRFYKLNIEHDFERKLDDLVTEFLKELGKFEPRKRVEAVLLLSSRLVEFGAFEAARETLPVSVPDLILTSAWLDKTRNMITSQDTSTVTMMRPVDLHDFGRLTLQIPLWAPVG